MRHGMDQVRLRVKALGEQHEHDPTIQKFVREMEEDRMILWEAWKRGLRPEPGAIVQSVREPHQGPERRRERVRV